MSAPVAPTAVVVWKERSEVVVDQIPALVDWFDWALNEECVAYDECDAYEDWTKAVLHAEYVDDWSDADALHAEVCEARPEAFSTLVKTWDLGPEYLPCG